MTQNVRRRFTILKWIPRVLILAIIGFAVYFGLNYAPETEKKPVAPPTKEAQKKTVRNIEYSHFDKGKLIYKVTAEQVITLKSEQQQLRNPEFVFYDENGKEMVGIKGKHCHISRDFNSITVFDDTHVLSRDRMSVKTHQIKYEARRQRFITKNKAHFDWGTLEGESEGFDYDIENQQLEMTANPVIRYVNKNTENRRPIVMKGNRGFLDRKTGFAFFEGNVVITQGKDVIRAHRIEAAFKPGGNDLEKITASKNVKIRFGRPGEEPQDTTPTTNKASEPSVNKAPPSMTNVFTTEASTGKDLEAQYVELYFYPDGSTIRSFHSTGDCTLFLHTFNNRNKPIEDRIIKGDTFDATFDQNGDMEQFKAAEKVSVKLQPLGNPRKQQPAADQIIYCKFLDAMFVSQTGEVKEIQFNKEFKHVQGSRTVSSDKAVYVGKLKKTDLTGKPEIRDASFRITSDSMELLEENSGILAHGSVKSEFVRSEGKTPMTFPFSSPSNQPVYISSDEMNWDSQKSEATYSKKAKLWQEKNVITADKMIINDREKTLSAYDKVHTIFYQGNKKNSKQGEAKSAEKAKAKEKPKEEGEAKPEEGLKDTKLFSDAGELDQGPISVDAGIMNYAEKDRVIHFEKDVKIVTQATRINSDKADFFLKEKTSEFDRLFALGNVSISHEGRKGTGTQATFFAKEQKLILEGNPKLSEAGKADIHGRILTLFLSDDRILIDGQEDGRATTTLQMKGRPTPPPDSSKNIPDAASEDRELNKKL